MAQVPASEIQKLFDRITDNSGIVGGYILIAEVLKDEQLELQIFVSRGVSPWSATGMLSEAMAIVPVEDIVNVEFEGDLFDQDEDDFE